MKTPFLKIAPIAAALAIPESSIIVLPQQSPHTSIALPSIEVNSHDEFIGELVEGFYKSLKRFLPIIFKSTRTSFDSWRPIFSRATESIQDVEQIIKAESLEKLITNLEKDISEWSKLRKLDLTPLIEAELECLTE